MLHRQPTQDVLWAPAPGTAASVPVRAIGPAVLFGLFVSVVVYSTALVLLLLRSAGWRGTPSRVFLTALWRAAASFPLAAAIPAALLGLLVAWALWRPEVREKQLGGPLVWQGRDAIRMAKRMSVKNGIRLHPCYAMPLREWCRHVLVSGSVGSGKTQIIEPIVEQVVDRNLRCLILDLKGDYTSHLPSTAILSPWDSRSLYWDIAADLRTRDEAAAFADALIPLGHGDSKHWDESCQQILTGIVVALYSSFPNDWGWQELANALHEPVGVMISMLKQHAPHAVNLLSEDPDSKMTQSVLSSLAAHTRVIDDLARAWGTRKGRTGFSVRRWAQHSRYPIRQVCLHAGQSMSASRGFLGAVVSLANQHLLALPDNPERGVFIFLDELTAVGKVDLAGLFERGRSKGVACVAGFQDLSQVVEVYGPHFAQALPAMVGTQIICQIGPGETRDKVSAWCGSQRWAVPSLTHGADGKPGSLTVHEESRHAILSTELTSELGPVVQGKRFLGISSLVLRGGNVLALQWPGRNWEVKRAAKKTAHWAKPVLPPKR